MKSNVRSKEKSKLATFVAARLNTASNGQNKIPPDNKWPAVTMRWRKLVCLVFDLSRIQFMSVHVSGGVSVVRFEAERVGCGHMRVWWQYATLHLPNSPMRLK